MRITQGLLVNNLLYDLRQSGARLAKAEEQLSTLRVINRPSDDPVGTVTALRLRNSIADIDRYTANINDAKAWLDDTESALTGISGVIDQAIRTGSQGNSGALSVQAREALAHQIDGYIREVVDLTNQTFQGKSIFGGHRTSDRVATSTEALGFIDTVTFGADNGSLMRQINEQTTLRINNTASDILGPAGTDLFTHLIGLRSAVLNGNTTQITSLLDRLNSHQDRVLGLRTEVGAKVNRLLNDKDRYTESRITAVDLLSQIEDTDVARASVEFSSADNAYRATLAVGAKIIMPTLLDFLK